MNTSGSGARSIKFWLITATLALLGIIYFVFDPAEAGWMPRCMLNYFTGFDCPGCGAQRAVHALLHGDVATAFEANALLVCMLPLLGGVFFVELRRRQMPKTYAAIHHPALILTIMAVVIGWGVARNL